jgi:hypothetical protein
LLRRLRQRLPLQTKRLQRLLLRLLLTQLQ